MDAARDTRVDCAPDSCRLRVEVLDRFAVFHHGERVVLSASAQRLLAFLALQRRPSPRLRVAFALWPEASEPHSFGSLRSALFRLRRPGYSFVAATGDGLSLAAGIEVDVREAMAYARRLLAGEAAYAEDFDHDLLAAELLPSWYDDWVLLERERHRDVGLRALEILSDQYLCSGRVQQAAAVAWTAIQAEPLRESSQRALIRANLAEGNHAHALARYQSYRRLLQERLGLEPSPQLEALVAGLA